MMRSIHLHGRLKKEFGPTHRFDVETAGEALRALNCAYPGKFVGALKDGAFKIMRGDRFNGMSLDLDLVNELRLGAADLHIMPVAAGAANGKGTTKIILGSALIGGAIFLSGGTLAAPLSAGLGVTWGNIATVGLGIALAGASTLLSKASTETAQNTANDTSFMTNGPGATGQQGSALPLIYGETMATPIQISIDADIEDIGAYRGAVGPLGWHSNS